MDVEKVLVSSIQLTILILALWNQSGDMYIFHDPVFKSNEKCIEYVLENHYGLNKHISREYGSS